jgi:hypothetical protein
VWGSTLERHHCLYGAKLAGMSELQRLRQL